MRFIFFLCVGLVAAYWIDHAYYGRAYGRAGVDVLRHIIVSYK